MDINISARKLNGACSHFVVLRPIVRAGNLHSIIVFPLNQGEYFLTAWEWGWSLAHDLSQSGPGTRPGPKPDLGLCK